MFLKLYVILFTGGCIPGCNWQRGVCIPACIGAGGVCLWVWGVSRFWVLGGVNLPGNTSPWSDTPSHWDDHLNWRYAAYWNAFLFPIAAASSEVAYIKMWFVTQIGKDYIRRTDVYSSGIYIRDQTSTNLCLLHSNPIQWCTPTLPRSNFYRPQCSCGKVMFVHLSVILSTVQSTSVHAGICTPAPRQTHPTRRQLLLRMTMHLTSIHSFFFIFTIAFKEKKTE